MGSKLHKKYTGQVKRLLIIFGISILITSPFVNGLAQTPNKIKRVVIDAGHGGKDPGALGKNSKEKDIALSVALKAGKYIEENFEDVEVFYTRKADVFVELHKRAQIANESGADLFISIHCNSNPSSKPYGSETFVMGLHKSQDNLEVAKTENAAIFYEEDYEIIYEGFNPNSDEDYIVLSMFQSANIDQSINISSKVQSQFRERVGRRDRGVKQAGFWVLYKTTMPGILIELGFLSNPSEEAFLLSEEGQVYLASAIYRAFKEYKKEYESVNDDLKPLLVNPKDELPQLEYRVQFASYKKKKPADFRKFKELQAVKQYVHMGMYKYTVGEAKSLEDAKVIKERMIAEGYKKAFIVPFADNERIGFEEARKIEEKLNNK